MTTGTDWQKVATALDGLYASVDLLQSMFPGRKFTPDGHLVGSLGEVLAAYMFGLELLTALNTGYDAVAADGRCVEIKLTQGRTVALRYPPDHLLVLARPFGSAVEVVYNGPGESVWNIAGAMQSNGQRPISLAKLRRLCAELDPRVQLTQLRESPI